MGEKTINEKTRLDKRRYSMIYKTARQFARLPLRKYQFKTDQLPKTDEPYNFSFSGLKSSGRAV